MFLPNSLKAAFQGIWGNVIPSNTMDLVGQTEADLQPVVDVKSHHSSCAEAGVKHTRKCLHKYLYAESAVSCCINTNVVKEHFL